VKKKISSGAGLLFKGSGFYITDYRSENYKQSAKNASTETKPAAKTEAKPAPKADKK
jgi:predicted nucleic acid-binding Zn ribbon protein